MTVVTGVSGSGKSSLIKGILYPSLKRHLGEVCDAPGEYLGLLGDIDAVKHVEFVDQNPIGKSTRSNPATYVKAYDAIRDLFADQPLAQQMGFTPQYFSFNADGGAAKSVRVLVRSPSRCSSWPISCSSAKPVTGTVSSTISSR